MSYNYRNSTTKPHRTELNQIKEPIYVIVREDYYGVYNVGYCTKQKEAEDAAEKLRNENPDVEYRAEELLPFLNV